MKVIIEYDETTGQLQDRQGTNVGNWLSLDHFGAAPDPSSNELTAGRGVDALALIDRGWTPDQILEARKVGLV